jgi:hypothetical protein
MSFACLLQGPLLMDRRAHSVAHYHAPESTARAASAGHAQGDAAGRHAPPAAPGPAPEAGTPDAQAHPHPRAHHAHPHRSADGASVAAGATPAHAHGHPPAAPAHAHAAPSGAHVHNAARQDVVMVLTVPAGGEPAARPLPLETAWSLLPVAGAWFPRRRAPALERGRSVPPATRWYAGGPERPPRA